MFAVAHVITLSQIMFLIFNCVNKTRPPAFLKFWLDWKKENKIHQKLEFLHCTQISRKTPSKIEIFVISWILNVPKSWST